MKLAAFKATYSDFKLIKTRQCVQIIFEVPLAYCDAAMDVLGGMPDPAQERWFGIAPLVAEKEIQQLAGPAKEKKNWRDMPPAQQAAIRCGEPSFAVFLREEQREHYQEDIAQAVRDICCVKSRSELNTNHQARVIWNTLDGEYQAWKMMERV